MIMKQPLTPPRGLSRIDAAFYVGVSATHFDLQVAEGVLPKPIKMGGRFLYDRKALDSFFDSFNETVPALGLSKWDN